VGASGVADEGAAVPARVTRRPARQLGHRWRGDSSAGPCWNRRVLVDHLALLLPAATEEGGGGQSGLGERGQGFEQLAGQLELVGEGAEGGAGLALDGLDGRGPARGLR